MIEAPTHVKQAIETRRRMRRARRFRLWRRPCRSQNRVSGAHRLSPSTRSRWEAKARVVRQLAAILPLTGAALEDVQAEARHGRSGQWNQSFSPVQVGKEHLYRLLTQQGLIVYLFTGIVTKQLRDHYCLSKTSHKEARTFSSHAVDAWVLAASTSGAHAPTCTRLWYGVPHVVHRRQLHRLEAAPRGVRQPYGGTRSLGFKRGTLVRHPRYGLCTIGGYDRGKQRLSLHAYQTNQRLTQHAKPAECHRLTTPALRCWLVRVSEGNHTTKKKGVALPSHS
jgi:hypothetical protein